MASPPPSRPSIRSRNQVRVSSITPLCTLRARSGTANSFPGSVYRATSAFGTSWRRRPSSLPSGSRTHVHRAVGRSLGLAPVGEPGRGQARHRGVEVGDGPDRHAARDRPVLGEQHHRTAVGHPHRRDLGAEATEVPQELGPQRRSRRRRGPGRCRRRPCRGRRAGRARTRSAVRRRGSRRSSARGAGAPVDRARRARRRAGGSRGGGAVRSSPPLPTVSSRTVVPTLGRNTWRPNGNTRSSPSSSTENCHGSRRPCSHAQTAKSVAHWSEWLIRSTSTPSASASRIFGHHRRKPDLPS